MKKLWIASALGLLFLGSCAQKKENRDEYKEEHNKDSLRNELGNTAVPNSERAQITADDSLSSASQDTAESPTNYQRMRPNTEAAGAR